MINAINYASHQQAYDAGFVQGAERGRLETAYDSAVALRRWAIELASGHHCANGCVEDIIHHAAALVAYVEGKTE